MANLPSDDVLQKVWTKVRKDPAGRKALRTLKLAGYDYLETMPASKNSVSGLIATVPFLPNKRARTRIQQKLPSARPLIRFLRELNQTLKDEPGDVKAHEKRTHTLYGRAYEKIQPPRLAEAADLLEWVFSMRWAVIQHNPYKRAISEIRSAFICCTGKPHDRELLDLLDAAFRAAGKPGCPLEIDSLKKGAFHISRTELAAIRKLLGPRFEL